MRSSMNLTGISNLSSTYIQSLLGSLQTGSSTNGTTSNKTDSSSLLLPQDGNAQLSPFAQVLSALQQLQQSNPTQYQQVTAQIATNLQSAANTATADGNTTQATQLNQLASDFNSASQNNTLPNIQDLAQAMHGGHGHHHHHAVDSSSSSSDSSSTDSSTTSASTTSASGLSQLLSAFMVNSTTSTQNSALNPLSIITNTLENDGISLG